MIQFKSWKQYTHIVKDGVRFPQNPKNPFVLIYFSENSNFISDHSKLNLYKQDFRYIMVPNTRIPKSKLTTDLIKEYRNLKLIPYNMKQRAPKGQNIIIDLSVFLNNMDLMFKPKSYRQRPGTLITNILNNISKYFPEEYQLVLFYAVDLTKSVNVFINKKIFPIIKSLKVDEFLFDHMLISYLDNESSTYRLLVKNNEFNFQRTIHYIRTIEGLKIGQNSQANINKAADIVIKATEKDIGKDPAVKKAIEKYLEDNPNINNKVLSGEITADKVRELVTTSILYGVSGDKERANQIAKNIPISKKRQALKAINSAFSKDLLLPKPTITLSTDPRIQVYQPQFMVENKSPEHIYEKRQIDFKKNLKNDLNNSFKVLESKDIPLNIKSINIVNKEQRVGEIAKTDLSTVKVELTDSFDNEHLIEIDIPRIDPNSGIFHIHGKQKALINQLVQNPITFPQPGESRFESSYSVFRIYVKSTRKVKYLESFMTYKIPLIYLLSYSFGFEETLKQYKITYKYVEEKPKGVEYFEKIENNKYIVFENVKTDTQKYLAQSFLQGKPSRFRFKTEFGTQDWFEQYIIKISGRINAPYLISSNLQNIVDPVAEQVLRSKQLPTDLELIMKYMAENVVKEKVIRRNDLSNQRIRNSEVLVHLAQKQILAAYTVYKEQVLTGNTEAKFTIPQTKLLSDFLLTEIVSDMEYANPVEEMSVLSRLTPSGKKVGGIPDKNAIQMGARNIHESYYGNIDTVDTPEGPNIGVIQQLTINALITSSRGLIGTKDIDEKEKSGILSTSASMIPFIENTDGARVIMATNQAKQMLPLKNPQPPIVQSGYESVLTNVLSDNFIKKAPCSGKIVSVTRDYITIKCGKTNEKINIVAKHLRSGSGKDTLSVFKPLVKPGDNVKENQVIAEGACMSNGTISLGRPMLVAMMPYKGYNFEDGVVINKKMITDDKLTSLHGIIVDVIVEQNDRVLQIASIGDNTPKGEPLLRKTLGEIEQLIGFEEDESSELLGGQYIKKSPGGRIVDIEVYSNIKQGKVPLLDDLSKRTRQSVKLADNEKFRYKGEIIKGALIKFKVEQELVTTMGDKLCNRYGNKGIISLIEEDHLMPRLPDGRTVDLVFNPIGLINRMNIGQLFEMYCGLISKELANRIPKLTRKQTMDLIGKVYQHLDTTPNKKSTKRLVNNIGRISNAKFNELKQQVLKNGFFPIIVPPFQGPKHDGIKKALKVLDLKTGYKLTLPSYNGVKTHYEVPCGYQYIAKLEHLAAGKVHGRSTGPLVSKTMQPTAGKRAMGGQRVGEMDSWSFINYNCPNVLAEFFGPMSDDQGVKEEMLSEIIQFGETGYKHSRQSPVKELLNSYFLSLMLTR